MPKSYPFIRQTLLLTAVLLVLNPGAKAADRPLPPDIAPFFQPPAEFANDLGSFRSPLLFNDGRRVTNASEWTERRKEIRDTWTKLMGPWPELLKEPAVEYISKKHRDNFTQHRVRVEVASGMMITGYLLVPDTKGPKPAVLVPFYDPETSIGLGKPMRDFAYQLAKRGFVTLSIGSPGGDARRPIRGGATCQPLSFLGYIAANCHTALARMPEVDPKRIGVTGHSYGGKWSMFASCLDDRFACAVWSDPGIVFDEPRISVNYWEPWYLGYQPDYERAPGLISDKSPRTGAYKKMIEQGRDLHELQALMAPRPFLVSGGSEDSPARWKALNHSIAVNRLLGLGNRVAMTNRPKHDPTDDSNEAIFRFFEHFLKP
ncbi:MAG TPA: prolyl oligopeptidase family serine peptidase [Roseimicrobium sp.]|nr:prolyl oligopeptidase family serine peptidase [Roseimicrobium sp.]